MIHKAFLLILLGDLIIIPFLALLDLGFAQNISSNFFARYFYIISLFIAFAALLKDLVFPKRILIFVFLGALVLGIIRGLSLDQINSAFLSHIFYYFMPIIMMAYGSKFMTHYRTSKQLRNNYFFVMISAYWFGCVIIIAFSVTRFLGLANYDAIGTWNFLFSAPLLINGPNGNFFLLGATVMIFASGKRGTILAFLVIIALILLLSSRRKRMRIVALAVFLSAMAFIFQSYSEVSISSRLSYTIDILRNGNFDIATGMRLSEAAAAIEYLKNNYLNWIFGSGFGVKFLPWPDRVDYSNYYSHYVHIGAISYLLISGIFFSVFVYLYFLVVAFRLLRAVWQQKIILEHQHFIYIFCGTLVISLFGAVLMNNTFLWFFIGCCLEIDANYRYEIRNTKRAKEQRL